MSLACHENANEGKPRILKPILSAAGINKWINIFFPRVSYNYLLLHKSEICASALIS